MIGSVFYGQSNLRQRYLIIAGVGAALTVAGLLAVPWLGVIGLTLAGAGAVAAIRPAPRFQVELRPEGLHYQPGDRLLPYGTIVAVTGLRKHNDPTGLKPFSIDVCTADTGIRIPAHRDVPARELEEFLISRASPFITAPADADVSQFYDQECARFGPDQVALYHGRTIQTEPSATQHLRWFALGWVIGAIAAMVLFSNLYPRNRSLGDTGATMLVIGIIFLLTMLGIHLRYRLKRQAIHTDDSIVVGPSGLALRQGKLKGKLRWDELRNIVMKAGTATASSGTLSTGGIGRESLHLQVAGAVIVLTEVYDRSLARIKQTIELHHRQGRVS